MSRLTDEELAELLEVFGPSLRLTALVAEVRESRARWAVVRDALHSLPDPVLAAVAAKCRETPVRCFCGCHVSRVPA